MFDDNINFDLLKKYLKTLHKPVNKNIYFYSKKHDIDLIYSILPYLIHQYNINFIDTLDNI
jgi:hypothetical protein